MSRGDLTQIEVFESNDAKIVHSQEAPHMVLGAARKGQDRARIELARGDHRGQSIEVRVQVGSDQIHAGILAGFERGVKAEALQPIDNAQGW